MDIHTNVFEYVPMADDGPPPTPAMLSYLLALNIPDTPIRGTSLPQYLAALQHAVDVLISTARERCFDLPPIRVSLSGWVVVPYILAMKTRWTLDPCEVFVDVVDGDVVAQRDLEAGMLVTTRPVHYLQLYTHDPPLLFSRDNHPPDDQLMRANVTAVRISEDVAILSDPRHYSAHACGHLIVDAASDEIGNCMRYPLLDGVVMTIMMTRPVPQGSVLRFIP